MKRRNEAGLVLLEYDIDGDKTEFQWTVKVRLGSVVVGRLRNIDDQEHDFENAFLGGLLRIS